MSATKNTPAKGHDDELSDAGTDTVGQELLASLAMFNNGRKKCFAAQEVIYHENDTVDTVFVIRSGMVKLLSHLPNGRARIVRLHGTHHWLGLEGLVERSYEQTAVAVDDVEVVCISVNELHLLEQEDPRTYCQVLKQGLTDLAQADRWIADFSTGGIKPRVARLVEFLSNLEFGESSNVVDLLTVHEMADMLGVTQESVSRILAEFKRNSTLHKIRLQPDSRYEIDAQQLQYEARQ
jgi:CRP/FNR family transcriptional regulator